MQDDPATGAQQTDEPDDPQFGNERRWEVDGTMRRGQPVAFSAASPDPDAPIAEPRFLVDWVDQHHESTYPPDPAYPSGTAIDVALDAQRACRVELVYPAERCGLWVITCRACGYSIALATAGRADDPCSVRVPCQVG
jgi:hypothetical protein